MKRKPKPSAFTAESATREPIGGFPEAHAGMGRGSGGHRIRRRLRCCSLARGLPPMGTRFDSVQMERLYAIALKNGRTEYQLDARQPEVTVPCVRALFPHLGYSPCWYLRRNSQKPIPMVILISARP